MTNITEMTFIETWHNRDGIENWEGICFGLFS